MRCPRCDSFNPKLHPAVQSEGEVHVCSDPWHAGITTKDNECPTCKGTGEMVTDWKPENGIGWTKTSCIMCDGTGITTEDTNAEG